MNSLMKRSPKVKLSNRIDATKSIAMSATNESELMHYIYNAATIIYGIASNQANVRFYLLLSEYLIGICFV